MDTYGEFLDSNQALLQSIAAPKVAKDYYESADMYIFDEFQTSRPKGTRRPRVETLYDVFSNIRDDEKEHVATMSACQDPEVLLRSPNTEAAIAASALSILLLSYLADEMSVEQLFSSLSTGTTNSALEGVLSNTDMAGTEGEMLEGMASSEQFIQAISGMGGALYKILGAVSKLLPIL